MSNDSKRNEEQRFSELCDFIFKHLDEDLSVDKLSKVAHFSKYHFHRQFSVFMGISLSKYIQLLRLKRASYQLVFDQKIKVIDIALETGFESPESFSRAFKKNFQQTPSQFRKQPKWKPWHEKYNKFKYKGVTNMQVSVVNFKETHIAVLAHRGDPSLLNDSVQQFITWRKQTGLSPIDKSMSLGLVYDDPKNTQPEAFRYDICGSVLAKVPSNTFNIINKSIPAGRCAVIRHIGSHDLMQSKIYDLYGKWLPQSQEALRDFPLFFHFLNLLPDVAENELMTDIYLPIK